MKISELSNKELKKQIVSYDDLIYGEYSCFRTRDLRYYDELLMELEKRNLTITVRRSL